LTEICYKKSLLGIWLISLRETGGIHNAGPHMDVGMTMEKRG
jgi:hypothetical protein